ncbi:EamA family transporter [Tabrizicola sp. WMC-M-20]|nr:EamA family transporter [Tabrizicola sp. WMC-M-20]
MRMSCRDWGLLLLLSFLWGGAFFFAAVAVKELAPLTVVLLRTGLAAMALAVVLRVGGEGSPFRVATIPSFLIMGLLNNLLPFSLLFWAQTVISSGLASILNATTPIFAIIAAHFLLSDERVAVNKIIGIVFGFLGVVVLLGGGLLDGKGFAVAGMLACLGAALSYGLAATYGRRFRSSGLSSVQVALGQLTATTLMMINNAKGSGSPETRGGPPFTPPIATPPGA